MSIKYYILPLLLLVSVPSHGDSTTPDFWRKATVYFMLTDRFNNADPSSDQAYGRTHKAAPLRGFEGGDIKGITAKIRQGYFADLGVDAIWMTPLIEQIHGYDSSAGDTYAYHGYWPKDWTAVDQNFGSEADLKEMIEVAHEHGIKVLLDVVINHTGPATAADWAWPESWIRTAPLCQWHSYQQNVKCALATSLTDIKTETETDVALPKQLLAKWQREGRLEQELAELDDFFTRTGYPRAPKYYIVKWLTDWVREYGVDGFRVDTVKHVEAQVWQVLKRESQYAFAQWKANNPQKVKDQLPFYMVGEVYNWGLNGFSNTLPNSRVFDYGDKRIDFFDYGFDALINMALVSHLQQPSEALFSDYAKRLNSGELRGKAVLSYVSSHDDEHSFDRERKDIFATAFNLMLLPGGVQIYYGDEVARKLNAEPSARGDAHLRTPMNWSSLSRKETQAVLSHWQKLGQFRQQHPAVALGHHQQLMAKPYLFKRQYRAEGEGDQIIAGKGWDKTAKKIAVAEVFTEGQRVKEYYSNQVLRVRDGYVEFNSDYSYVLLGRVR